MCAQWKEPEELRQMLAQILQEGQEQQQQQQQQRGVIWAACLAGL
jgi:hypothetical protein